MAQRYLMIAALVLIAEVSSAADFHCKPTKKVTSEHTYTAEELSKWKFATKVEERGDETFLLRCSYSSMEEKVTCDRYMVDRIEYDENVFIKKYYYFRGQANVQIFSGMTYLEDNGRGDIAFGKCRVTSP